MTIFYVNVYRINITRYMYIHTSPNGRRSPIGAYRRYQLGGSGRVMLCLLGGTLLAYGLYINFQLGLWACLVDELCSAPSSRMVCSLLWSDLTFGVRRDDHLTPTSVLICNACSPTHSNIMNSYA